MLLDALHVPFLARTTGIRPIAAKLHRHTLHANLGQLNDPNRGSVRLKYWLARMSPSASLAGFRDFLVPAFGAVRIVVPEIITLKRNQSLA